MNKKQLSERDICTEFITPSLPQAGWDGGELEAQIAIGKEDNTQATRSYSTASSISPKLRS
jgi:type I site-specific restriction endonuclease